MGVELELYVLLAIFVLGSSIFAVFEVETARWRKILKWVIVSGGTVGLYYAVGHLALVFPLGLTAPWPIGRRCQRPNYLGRRHWILSLGVDFKGSQV